LEQLTAGYTVIDVCDMYLYKRAEILGFTIHSWEQRGLYRIFCQLRLQTAADARKVVEVMQSIDPVIIARLLEEMNVTGLEGKHAILLYYSPALLLNLQAKLQTQQEKEAKQLNPTALGIGLLTLDKLYRVCRDYIVQRSGNGVFTANIADVAAAATQAPESLLSAAFAVMAVGTDGKVVVQRD